MGERDENTMIEAYHYFTLCSQKCLQMQSNMFNDVN